MRKAHLTLPCHACRQCMTRPAPPKQVDNLGEFLAVATANAVNIEESRGERRPCAGCVPGSRGRRATSCATSGLHLLPLMHQTAAEWAQPGLASAEGVSSLCRPSTGLLGMLNWAGDRLLALAHRGRSNTLAGSRKNIEEHYDAGAPSRCLSKRLSAKAMACLSCGVM